MKKIYLFLLITFIYGENLPSLNSWFSASRLSMSGGGALLSIPTSRSQNPANKILEKTFSTSFILYPADIQAQSIALSYPFSDRAITICINHISYGIFQGYDSNSLPTNKYDSNDTWLRFVYSTLNKNKPINYGFSSQIYFSNLESQNINRLLFSFGVIWELKKHEMKIGFSAADIIINMNFIDRYFTPFTKYDLGINKKLKYLPLTISIDYLIINNLKKEDIFLSGVFDITKTIQLSLGTSTRKIEQNTNNNLIDTIFGSSGIGFQYKDSSISFGYGMYFYGTGGYTNGIDLSVEF